MVGQARLSAPRLEVRDLWVNAPGTSEPVVRGVSMDLAAGEWVAVTGPNGCGKTTLAHAIAGLLPHLRGSVRVDGRPLGSSSAARACAGVSAVLQEPSSQLFEPTVEDEIAFAPRNLGWEEARIRESTADWSRRLGLDHELGADPRQLSAGRQQLVLIAAALASNPSILVSDEGAAHLDPSSRRLLIAILRDETRRGLSIVWITQHSDEIDAADRAMRMDIRTPAKPEMDRSDRPVRSISAPGKSAVLDVRLSPSEGAVSGPCVRLGEELRFRLEPGRVLALTGPNGSGKTVVLESIAGLLKVDQVVLTWSSDPGERPVLASQYPDLAIVADTVGRDIEFGAEKRGVDRKTIQGVVDDLFRTLDLDSSLLSRSPWELSSGERRLMQVIAALVTPASVLLLDEPTGGVDPDRCERLARVIVSRSRTSAFLIASQDDAWVSRIGARRVALGN